MRLQLALDVTDLDAAVDFYTRLFDTEPAKRKPGYANFAIEQPPLKLVLFEGASNGTINHLGVEVEESDEVTAAADRLEAVGLDPTTVAETTCCHADKVETWVNGPDRTRWEWYVKTADVETDPTGDVDSTETASTPDSAGLPLVEALSAGPGCSLEAADLPARLTQAGQLRRHLRGVDRDGLRLTLRVDAAGRDEVDEFVRAESQCCSFFDFAQHDDGDQVVLEITAPADAALQLDLAEGILAAAPTA